MRRTSLVFVVGLFLVSGVAWTQGTPVGPEFLVNTTITNSQRFPSVATEPGGAFVVAWASTGQDGSSYGVFARRYDGSGAPLGPEFRINSYTASTQSRPSVAYPEDGFIVVWHSFGQDGSGYGVFGQRYDGSGAPVGSEFRVNTHTTDWQLTPSVAADPSGNFVVVWRSDYQVSPEPFQVDVFGQRYSNSGEPLGPEFLVNTITPDVQAEPSVATDGSGNFVVVWTSYGDGSFTNGIFGQRFDRSGARLGPQFLVNTYTTDNQGAPAVAADASGNFVVVWESRGQDGSLGGVFGQRFDSSGDPSGPEFRVNTYTIGNQRLPAIAVDASGNFVVAWQSPEQDGSGAGTFGQRYSNSGLPLGAEFRVNTFTLSHQEFPSVGADSSGNFVVVWESWGQDPSGYGIFGQRYQGILPVELMRFTVE